MSSPLYDSLPWRAAEITFALARRARRARRRHRQGAGSPPAAWFAARGWERPAGAGAAAWTAQALAASLQGNAFARAAEHARWLAARLGELDPSARRAALPRILEALVAVGHRADAIAIAEAHPVDLAATDAGATWRELLDLAPADALRLPSGRIHRVAVARRIERGGLDARGVDALLASRWTEPLAAPELHLLVHQAHRAGDPAAARAAFARYARATGLPTPLTAPGPTGLGAVRFAATTPARGPLVSVIVAARDAATTVGYAIDSLLAQSYRDLEILVADDASSDDTLAVLCDRYGDDPRVRVFASEANQGPYNLRNHLLGHARGELVTFHDADDLAVPTRIESQVRRLRRGEVAATLTTLLRVTPDGRCVFYRDHAAARLALVTLLAPRRLLAELGGFRPARFGADLDLHEKLRARVGDRRLDVVRAPQLLGLWSPSSLTRRHGAEALEDGFRAPARRAYAELVFERTARGLPDAAIDAALRDAGTWIDPRPVRELSRSHRPARAATSPGTPPG